MGLSEIRKICVIGAGTMGSGIAQKVSQSGFLTSILDVKDELVKKGFDNISKTLEDGMKRGKISDEEAKKILANIHGTTDLKEAVSNAQIIIEAVFEELEVKKKLFKELDELCPSDVIFATNTSSLSVTEMAKTAKRSNKFAGLHFFYPAALNQLVEVVVSESTSEETVATLTDLARALGKIPIRVKDAPGFVVNRYFVPVLNEACRLLEEKVTNIPTIDWTAKEAFSIGMGPFELMNATGIPIAYHSASSLGKTLGRFYQPSEILRKQFESGEKWKLEGEIDKTLLETVKNRFYGLVFGIACHIVEEGVATIEDVDKGATIGLRWKLGPFALMNSVGIERAYEIVRAFAESTDGLFKVPDLLRAQAEARLPWDIKFVKLVKEKNLGIILMARPEALNALNSKLLCDLDRVVDEARNDKDINVLAITGEGSAFVAGADIKEMLTKSQLEAREFSQLGQQVFSKIENLDKVVIAAVNGYALGGGSELALACDFIIASEKASFGLPEVGLGIHPGFGGTQRLPRLIGKPKAKELIFTGDIINAREAELLGLVNRVVAHNKLMDEVRALAKKIGSKGPISIKLVKNVINRGLETDLETALAYEIESVSLAFSTKDKNEGMKAFLEKRQPKFKGE